MLKPTKLNIEKQVRAGNDGDLLAVEGTAPEWQTPAEAGISTEAFAQERATEALEDANQYSDDRQQESINYTNSQTLQTKFELQNYTDDEVQGARTDLELQLADKADLVGGRVPSSQLPGFAETFEVYPTFGDFPQIGDPAVLYIAEDTNKTYRWVVPNYVELLGHLELGESETTAYRGDRGRIAYDHTLLANNPHQVNKTQVGLSEVDNTSDANKPVSIAMNDALSLKANLVHTHVQTDVTGLTAALSGKADAGTLATVATTGDYGDLLNKPPTAAYTAVSEAVLTPDMDQYVQYNYTQLDSPLMVNNPIGSSIQDGSRFILRINGSVTPRAISWGSQFRAVGLDMPVLTIPYKLMYIGALYNANDIKWDLVALMEQD